MEFTIPKTMNMAQNEPNTPSQARRPPSGKSSSSSLRLVVRVGLLAGSSISIVTDGVNVERALPLSMVVVRQVSSASFLAARMYQGFTSIWVERPQSNDESEVLNRDLKSGRVQLLEVLVKYPRVRAQSSLSD